MPPETITPTKLGRPSAGSPTTTGGPGVQPMPPQAAPPAWRVILGREFRQLESSRWYIAATVLGLLLILGLSFVPALLDYFSRQDAAHPEVIAVVAPEPGLAAAMQAALTAVPSASRPNWKLVEATPQQVPGLSRPLPAGSSWTSTRALLDPLVQDQSISGYIWVGQVGGEWQAKFTQRQISNSGFVQALLQPLVARWRAQAAGISPEQVAALVAPLPLENRELKPLFSDKAKVFSQILSYFLLFVLYMAVLFYGQMIITGIAQEKSSRVVELLVSAARPVEILTGKVLGIGLGGLVQFGVWTVVGLLVAFFSGPLQRWLPFQMGELLAAIPISVLLYFLIFFLLGYFLYAVISAALGSMVSRVEEAGSITFPMVFLVFIAYMLAFDAMISPDSRLVVVGSLIPFFTPMVMFTRLTMSAVPFWQVALSIVLTAATTVLLTGLASRLYQAHILRFQRVSWREGWQTLIHRTE
ncbi:MAG: ABC transporter permease [Limnochordaceae bacterium]|nr:ABC transporter permease [Limnochordaceae bacterium]